MTKRFFAALLLLASVAGANVTTVTASLRPVCAADDSFLIILTETTATSDCTDTGGGSDSAVCFCEHGTYDAVGAGAGGTQLDDFDCPNGGVIVWDDVDEVYECLSATAETLEYDPDTAPDSGLDAAASDEFNGSVNTGLYTLGNTPTVSAEIDSLRLDLSASASVARKVVWYPAPASGDWTFATKVLGGITTALPANALFGVAALVTGTTGTPTLIEMGVAVRGTADTSISMYNSTSYTAAYSNAVGTVAFDAQVYVGGPPFYHRWRFVDSSNNLSYDVSFDGVAWYAVGTRSALSQNPTYVGLLGDQNTANSATAAYFEFARTITSGAGITTPWPIGASPTRLVVGGTTTELEYDPDMAPSADCAASGAVCDEFNGAFGQSAEWGNQGTATDVISNDGALLTAPANASANIRCRWWTPPASGNWTYSVKVAPQTVADNGNVGIHVLATGTVATPTSIKALKLQSGGSQILYAASQNDYVGTGGAANASTNRSSLVFSRDNFYLQWRFTDSGDSLTGYYSDNGLLWYSYYTYSLGANPVRVGRCVESHNGSNDAFGHYYFARLVNGLTGTIGDRRESVVISGVGLDLGNNGSMESSNVVAITTANDDYSAVSETTADESLTDFRKIPPYDNYDPARPPSTCATCDEFYDNTPTQTWTCGGGTISQTYVHDSMRITKAMSGSAGDFASCTVAAPSGSYTATAYLSSELPRNNSICGVGVIRTGTQATPTAFSTCVVYQASDAPANLDTFHATHTGYTNIGTLVGSIRDFSATPTGGYWIQLRYDASADTIGCYVSANGSSWVASGTGATSNYTVTNETSVTTDPPYVGFFLDDQAQGSSSDMACEYRFLRVRTDADRNDASD